ncbi:hypothetical protein EXIGLDRAFT_704510 [Exidia glandulosa HHB12029]|uniref:DH domain-containing protein n=1 Tax=Exidia glandulosa HHB12029 TaxID=1314781 RepID=A0A165KWI1_EXIGL|nr:hypothetical protein EXIGLDRAFT_704510 [Exidia glandulosa HHB12029]
MFSISSRRSSNSQGVLRKQRRPASEQTVSVTQFELVQQHRPPLDTRTMSTSMESSIYFASTVDYDDDDGMDDFFSRRLARELDTVVKTPPENLVHRVCQSDIGHGSSADYFDTMPTSPVSMFAGHGGRPSMSSEHAPSSTATHSSAADSQHVKRHKSKLRKPNRNSNSHPPSAFPGAVHSVFPSEPASTPQPGIFRRLTSWKRRSTPDVSRIPAAPSTASVDSQNIGVGASALSLPERAQPYPQRPLPSVRQPPRSDIGHSTPAAALQSDSFSSWASASVSGHGYDSSAHGHVGFCDTPATSVGALSIPPVPPLPAKLEDVLTRLRSQQQQETLDLPPPPPSPLSPGPLARRKPVPPMRDSIAEASVSIGQAFLDLDPLPSTPELVSDSPPAGSSTSGSEEHLQLPHTPPEGAPMPRLRPPLPRLNSSRRWTMPSSAARAMLCAQEIVETEENYRRALGQLLRGETTFPPPAKLTALVPALLASSPRFAASALGPANAFIEATPALEKALVDWCAVVGGFFHPSPRSADSWSRGSRGKRDSLFSSDSSSSLGSLSARNVLRSRRLSRPVGQLAAERLGLSSSTGDLIEAGGKRVKVPTVQDLAIQPTQRAVRYVLLFRELLEHTHGEEREDVQRALDEAVRIAKRCDEALVIHQPQQQKTTKP